MSHITTFRRAGAAIFLIAALAACSQPTASPSTSAEPTSSVAASESAAPTADESMVITPSIDEEASPSADASDEPASGEIDESHPFADLDAMTESFAAGFEMFALAPMTETEVEGRTVFSSESPAGDAIVIVPATDGTGIETVRLVDVDARAEGESSPMLMWSTLITAILPEETDLGHFVNEQVFGALDSGESVDTSETFGALEVSVVAFDGNDTVTITVTRAD